MWLMKREMQILAHIFSLEYANSSIAARRNEKLLE